MFATNKRIKELEEALKLTTEALEGSRQRQIDAESMINQQTLMINTLQENLNICLQALNEHKTAIETLNQWALASKDAHTQLTHEVMGLKETVDMDSPAIQKNTDTIVGFDKYLRKVQAELETYELDLNGKVQSISDLGLQAVSEVKGLIAELQNQKLEVDYEKLVDEFTARHFSEIADHISISTLSNEMFEVGGMETLVTSLTERLLLSNNLVRLARQIALDAGLTDRVANKIVSRLAAILMSPTGTQPTWVAPIGGTQYPTNHPPFNPLQPSFSTCTNSDRDPNIS